MVLMCKKGMSIWDRQEKLPKLRQIKTKSIMKCQRQGYIQVRNKLIGATQGQVKDRRNK